MELRQLRHFVKIAEVGGFARAAVLCNISQPAISASVSHLEGQIGAALLERGSFGARLTAIGTDFYHHAKLILADVENARERMRGLVRGVGGKVSVGVGPLFEHTVMPAIISTFIARHPLVEVAAITGLTADLHDRVLRGELDFAVSSPPNHGERRAELDLEIIDTTYDVVAAARDHPVWDDPELTLARMARYPWIVSARVDTATLAFNTAFLSADVPPPTTIFRTDSIPILTQLILHGGFLCVLSPHFASYSQQLPSDRQLRTVSVPAFALPRSLSIARRTQGLLTPAVADLITIVRRHCSAVTVLDRDKISEGFTAKGRG